MLKLGSKLTTVSARIAGKKLIGKQDDTKDSRTIIKCFRRLKGPLMKVAQLLSTVLIYYQKNMRLNFNNFSLTLLQEHFLKRRMRSELGINWQKKFDYFNNEASKAALLGQVHKAKSGNIDLA